MPVSFNKFNQFIEDVFHGVHDMKTGTSQDFKMLLTNTAPNAADTVVDTTTTTCTVKSTSNAAEIAAGNGYTKGGISGGTVTGAQTSGTFKFALGTDAVWTASGTVGPFRYVVIYNNTAGTSSTRPVIGWWDYGSSVTLNNGENFTDDLDQSAGVIQCG